MKTKEKNRSERIPTKNVFILIFIIVLLVAATNSYYKKYYGTSIPGVVLTGKSVTTGIVQLIVEGDTKAITIYSPLNTTYNFDVNDAYNISLNVSANFSVSQWAYSIRDLRHNTWKILNQTFTPNISIIAARWGNRVDVLARETGGSWYQASVTFYVNVPNSAPLLNNISKNIYVCEGNAINYKFNATDVDEDTLISDINPKNPFFTESTGTLGYNISLFRIFSGNLTKAQKGLYQTTISVDDQTSGSCCVDTAKTNITVIEINNQLTLQGIGAQTVWTTGENSTFYHEFQVTDQESGTQTSGNFSFNITFAGNENLFTINNLGIINYTPQSDELGTYALQVCANDTGLASPHPNISLCYPKIGSATTQCDPFTLTVTNANRAPRIINYAPNQTTLGMNGKTQRTFSVAVTDPDGTIPDIDWYVAGILQEHNENISYDTFTYAAPCGVSGLRRITASTTDGLLTATVNWNVTITSVACTTTGGSSGGGGGGGGGGATDYCREQWGCDSWETCLNAYSSYTTGELRLETYAELRELCLQNGLGEEECGYQKRTCQDTNYCNNTIKRVEKPETQQFCQYIEGAGCTDGIKNCHNGACELKVDCGGPCRACATCSDGRKNQEEEGIDCGGPCPNACATETPQQTTNLLFLLLIILLIIAVSIILWRFLDILLGRGAVVKRRKEEETPR